MSVKVWSYLARSWPRLVESGQHRPMLANKCQVWAKFGPSLANTGRISAAGATFRQLLGRRKNQHFCKQSVGLTKTCLCNHIAPGLSMQYRRVGPSLRRGLGDAEPRWAAELNPHSNAGFASVAEHQSAKSTPTTLRCSTAFLWRTRNECTIASRGSVHSGWVRPDATTTERAMTRSPKSIGKLGSV